MDEKRFTLRMNSGLFAIIKTQADKNKRSVAKEIEFILEEYAANKGLLNPSDVDQ